MHITRIEIHNFRSIRKLEINTGSLAVLAGENNAGKSNILRALDLFFNTHKKFQEDDFRHGIMAKLIVMEVDLANIPVAHRTRLGADKLTDSVTIHFRYSRNSGRIYKNTSTGEDIEEKNIRKAFSDFFTYISPLRDITEHLNTEDGVVFSSTIAQILRDISAQQKRTLQEGVNNGFTRLNKLINRELKPLNQTIQRFLPNIEPNFFISTELQDVFSLLSLEVSEATANTPTVIERKGHGFHSLVVLGLYAYAMQKSVSGGILAIEEPELHLHPNLQRQYAVLMRKLTSKRRVQILCTTHSTFLINQIGLQRIAKITKTDNETQASQLSTEYIENELGDFERNLTDLWSELYLTRFIVLVEGPSERQSIPKWASRITVSMGRINDHPCTFANNSIGIYQVGSSSNFQGFMRFLREYNTPFAVLADYDALKHGRILEQLQSAGVISTHEKKIYSTALKAGRLHTVISSLKRKSVHLAINDYEDLIVDSTSKDEVERIIKHHANDEYVKFADRSKTGEQILKDFTNQTANRIIQFKQRLGIKKSYTKEKELATTINKSFEALFSEANTNKDISVTFPSEIECLKKFIKKDKVLWHVRLSRGTRSGTESKALGNIIRDIVKTANRLTA